MWWTDIQYTHLQIKLSHASEQERSAPELETGGVIVFYEHTMSVYMITDTKFNKYIFQSMLTLVTMDLISKRTKRTQ